MLVTSIFTSPEHKVLRVSYCDLSVRPFTITKKKKSSSPKLTIRFQQNFTKMILRSCSFKILQRFEFLEELWLPWQQSEKKKEIFLSQTVRARAFIFGMYHDLMMFYQKTSNYGPGVEISPVLWGLGFRIEIRRKFLKIFLSQTVRARASICGM